MDQPNAHQSPSNRGGTKRFFVGILAALLLAGLGYPLWLYTVNTISERVSQRIAVQLHAAAKRVEQSQTATQPSPRPGPLSQSPSRQPAHQGEARPGQPSSTAPRAVPDDSASHDFSGLYQRLLREESARANEEIQADKEPSLPPDPSQPSPAQSGPPQSLLDLYLGGAGSSIGSSEDLLLQQMLQGGSLGL